MNTQPAFKDAIGKSALREPAPAVGVPDAEELRKLGETTARFLAQATKAGFHTSGGIVMTEGWEDGSDRVWTSTSFLLKHIAELQSALDVAAPRHEAGKGEA